MSPQNTARSLILFTGPLYIVCPDHMYKHFNLSDIHKGVWNIFMFVPNAFNLKKNKILKFTVEIWYELRLHYLIFKKLWDSLCTLR